MTRLCGVIVILGLSSALASHDIPQSELDDRVKQADASRQEYIRSFRDFTAVETWVTEILRNDGSVDRRRTVVSDLYVYQSKADASVIREYRITREVDGKSVGDPAPQALKLFRALGKARTLEQEDAALRQQNFRHVLRFIHTGLTVNPVLECVPDA